MDRGHAGDFAGVNYVRKRAGVGRVKVNLSDANHVRGLLTARSPRRRRIAITDIRTCSGALFPGISGFAVAGRGHPSVEFTDCRDSETLRAVIA